MFLLTATLILISHYYTVRVVRLYKFLLVGILLQHNWLDVLIPYQHVELQYFATEHNNVR